MLLRLVNAVQRNLFQRNGLSARSQDFLILQPKLIGVDTLKEMGGPCGAGSGC